MKSHVILLVAAFIVGILAVIKGYWMTMIAMVLLVVSQGIYVVRALHGNGEENSQNKE